MSFFVKKCVKNIDFNCYFDYIKFIKNNIVRDNVVLDINNLLVVTNNDKVVNKYSSSYNVEYVDKEGIYEVLIRVRDLIHNGYKLLTHPMSGSLKSNQTPYKSILILKKGDSIDFNDVKLIESAIENYDKFIKNRKLTNWPENIKNDFKTVDLSLIESCFNKNLPLNL